MGAGEPKPKKPTVYPPGMDELSTSVQRRLEVPMAIAAALTVPMVAITESHPGGALETFADILNWATWLAFLFELVVMLAIVPDRALWLRRNPLDLVLVVFTPPLLPPGLQGLRVLRLLRLLRLRRARPTSRNSSSPSAASTTRRFSPCSRWSAAAPCSTRSSATRNTSAPGTGSTGR